MYVPVPIVTPEADKILNVIEYWMLMVEGLVMELTVKLKLVYAVIEDFIKFVSVIVLLFAPIQLYSELWPVITQAEVDAITKSEGKTI